MESTEYYNNTLCLQSKWLTETGVVSAVNYKNFTRRGQLKVVRRGGNGRSALVEYKSIPEKLKEKIREKLGCDPERKSSLGLFERYIRADVRAIEYYGAYRLPDGRGLPVETQIEYQNNARILNALKHYTDEMRSFRKARGGSGSADWDALAAMVGGLNRIEYPHSLPANGDRLYRKFLDYGKNGFVALVHRGYCSQNSRKVTVDLERLILSVYCMNNKPYAKWVWEDYNSFVEGRIDIVDLETGELFDRSGFVDERTGDYIRVSESTCWSYINAPKNRVLVDAVRNPEDFNTKIAPCVLREAGRFSLSMVSMDDVDLPQLLPAETRDRSGRKCKHVKAYYAYDVTSGALIGASYSLTKDGELFLDCFRDMFGFLGRGGFGTPIEVQLEHHIAGDYRDGLLKEGNIFQYVTFCAPSNSQDKHAEHFNRVKKYGFAKRSVVSTGRFYARLEANRTGGERVWDDERQEYVIKNLRFSYDEIVATDREVIAAYNAGLHSDQERYPGMSRLDVFRKNLNPEALPLNAERLARYIGKKTKTSISRYKWVTVKGVEYGLSDVEVLGRLAPNNYEVEAFYMPAGEEIERVYIYQNDKFIDECKKIAKPVQCKAEWTDDDTAALAEQMEYRAGFNRFIKEGKKGLAKAERIKVGTIGTIGTNGTNGTNGGRDVARNVCTESILSTETVKIENRSEKVEIKPAYEFDPEYIRQMALEML